MTSITKGHLIDFIIRIILLILAAVSYFVDGFVFRKTIYGVIWVFFMFEMMRRLIPNKNESMGNQNVFKENLIYSGIKLKRKYKRAIIMAIVWLLGNSVFWVLYLNNIVNETFMFFLSLCFSVGDLVCVLIVCPFQHLILKNKCCTTCRVYNWDFAMMFTPLWVVPSFYNYSLVLLSLIILVHWEYNYYCYPEQFHEISNRNLQCKGCKELMCKNRWRKVVLYKRDIDKIQGSVN